MMDRIIIGSAMALVAFGALFSSATLLVVAFMWMGVW